MAAAGYTSPWRLNWLKALHKGDCLQIEKLLWKDKGLVTIYPRPGSCQDASDFAAHFGGWRGCSALHVAVKRGWPFLVQMIVNLFNEEPQPSNTTLLSNESRLSKAPSETRSLRMDPLLAAPSPVEIPGTSGGPGARVSHGDPTPADERKDSRENISLNLTMLEELLLAFDGDYHLDALALGVVNGNETIVRILAIASCRCRNNPYRVKSKRLSKRLEEDVTDRCATGFETDFTDIEVQLQISELTDKFLELHAGEQLQEYPDDPAYNFLPVKLFYFHHCIASTDRIFASTTLNNIMEELRKRDDRLTLMKFIFSLKDGRGKALAHVIPTKNVLALLETTDYWSRDERRCFMHVSDGAGRTVAHEYVARNDEDFLGYPYWLGISKEIFLAEITSKEIFLAKVVGSSLEYCSPDLLLP